MSNCVSNYLNYAGLDISELDILVDYDFQIVYTTDCFIPTLSGSIENAVWRFFEKNSIDVEKRNEHNDASFNLSASIRDNSMIIGHLPSKNLTYSSLFKNNNKINNTKHFLNIIGIDEINGIYISDGYIVNYPIRIFEGWIKLEDDESNDFYIINRKQLMNLPFNTFKNDFKLEIYRGKLIEIVRSFIEGGEQDDNYYGYSAYEKCILDITNNPNYDILYLQELFYRRAFHLTTGGLVSQKRIIKLLLIELSLEKYVSVMEKIIRKFELLKLLLLKCSFSFDKDNVLEVRNKLSEILQDELDFCHSILKYEQ